MLIIIRWSQKSIFNLSSIIFSFFFVSLESTMSHFTGSIDEFKFNLFQGGSVWLSDHTLSHDNSSLFGSNTASLNHNEIVSDGTIVRESSQWGDSFIGQICLSWCVSFVIGLSDSVDLLVNFSSMVITVLTGSGNGESNSGWMPWSDTSYSSVTSVGFLL